MSKRKSALGIPEADLFIFAPYRPGMKNEKFPSSEKLKSKILIDRLFTEGKSIKQFPIKLIYVPLERSDILTNKTGVSVPKRNFKKAVDRNYLKRLMREAYRKNKYLVESNLRTQYALMFIYTTPKKYDYHEINHCVIALLNKLKEREPTNEKIHN